MRIPIILLLAVFIATEVNAEWTQLAPGMELSRFSTKIRSPIGDSRITVLRIDPKLWKLTLTGTSWNNNTDKIAGNLTAKVWSEKLNLTAVINAGMFGADYTTHVGYLGTKSHVNNQRVNKYRSVAAFNPRKKGLAEFRIFDLDEPGVSMDAILLDYSSAVQNLRLIKRPGENRWSQQKKMWSEAALGEDRSGRILFIYSRSPFTMHDFNQELLSAGIGLVAAQHLEGGPEAQLYIRSGDEVFDLFGSYETLFQENNANSNAWPIPNIIGVQPR